MISKELMNIKPMAEVRQIATGLKLGWAKDEKKASIIDRIVELQSTAQPSDIKPVEPKQEAVALPQVSEKLEEAIILDAVKAYRAKGMHVSFNEHGWKFKLGNREDSGNYSIPITTVRRCAEMVCKASVVFKQSKLERIDVGE